MVTEPSIVAATGYVLNSNTISMMCLYENQGSSGMAKFQGGKHDRQANACYRDIGSADIWEACIPATQYNLKGIAFPDVSGQGIFDFGCMESYGCSAGANCTNRTCTTWGGRKSFITDIPIRQANASPSPAPTGLTITPGNAALTIGWNSVNDPAGGEVFAYRVVILDGGTTVVNGHTEAGLRFVTIGGLTNGKIYSVQVGAISHNGVHSSFAYGTGMPSGGVSCTAGIGSYSDPVKVGAKVPIPVNVTPATQPFTVKLKLRDGTVIGQCVTSNGSCIIIWDTAGKTPGAYYFRASVEGQCTSQEMSITLTKAEGGAGTIIGISLVGLGILGALIVATRKKKPEYTLPEDGKL